MKTEFFLTQNYDTHNIFPFSSHVQSGKSLLLLRANTITFISFVCVSSEIHNLQNRFFFIFSKQMGLRRLWNLGTRIVAWPNNHACLAKKALKCDLYNFSGTGRSTNSIAWKRWLLWNKWTLHWSEKKNRRILISKTSMVRLTGLSSYED